MKKKFYKKCLIRNGYVFKPTLAFRPFIRNFIGKKDCEKMDMLSGEQEIIERIKKLKNE